MNLLNEITVLDYYLERMKKDEIEFLRNRNSYKIQIKELILVLRDEKVIHNKIEISKSLWKVLFESAMSFIDPDKRGYDKLFLYFDKYVKFEELIFASDSFYRDHTLHCLWVYFFGEYIYGRKEFDFIMGKMKDNKEFRNIDKVHNSLSKSNVKGIFDDFLSITRKIKEVPKCDDSIRCIAAITHDLGYPIKKIHKINKCIKDVLPYFSIYNLSEFNFKYTETQQKYIEEFIESISLRVGAHISYNLDKTEKGKELEEKLWMTGENNDFVGVNSETLMELDEDELEIIKTSYEAKMTVNRVIDDKLRFLNDFEQYNHGIMSAFLISKTIESFSRSDLSYSDPSDLSIDHYNSYNSLAKQTIMRAISDHTSRGYQIISIKDHSSFLILMDELEEFSRISRANQNRQYINEFCKTNIYTDQDYLRVDFTFDNTDISNLDPELAFRGRCKRFLSLFRISDLDESLKIKLRCIGKLPYDSNVYELELRRKFASITINGEEKDIPKYLKSNEFYSKEEYMKL
ncbi:hypothetical protein [Brassicibacter mesophilus]|uniref:hypothetical protein n=1 Tax=Brassicibacter mesophilus TaxID=745119 RepID=UPI003D1EB45B